MIGIIWESDIKEVVTSLDLKTMLGNWDDPVRHSTTV